MALIFLFFGKYRLPLFGILETLESDNALGELMMTLTKSTYSTFLTKLTTDCKFE
jgi:hypothetical protein